MRQPQQNRRNRGRGRNNRSSNPLSRNYESNGPEVKIKGSAAHIAEKYLTLARDALSAGSTVTAENYFQHAEHYLRIIQAAQAKQEEQQVSTQHSSKAPRNNSRRTRPPSNMDEKAAVPEKVLAPVKAVEAEIPGSGKQPIINGSKTEASAPSEEKPKRKPRVRKPRAVKAEPKETVEAKEIKTEDKKDEQNNIIA